MGVNIYLLIALVIALLIIILLLSKLGHVHGQFSLIKDALEDMKQGNLNRRVLARESDMTKLICYDINQIAISNQARLIGQRQADQAYKRLMTSLFEWVKLDAGEQLFHFEYFDLNELSRNIMADWVAVLENSNFEYEIEIPETEYSIRIDPNAYTRILNNLLQNVIVHSKGNQIILSILENQDYAVITVKDNGIGISSVDLPHIFKRMYQADHSRSVRGNGLGLSIVKELVSAHKGKITVASTPGSGAEFTITLPKAL